jgi:hypothetical protein
MFALRLPNTIAGIGYVVVSFLVQKRGVNFISRIAIFVILISSYHLIAFFSLSRGYGLSFSFLLFTLWAYREFLLDKKIIYSILGLFAAVLALWSNLAMMIPVLVITVLFVKDFISFHLKFTAKEKVFFTVTILFCITLILKAIVYSLKLKQAGALYLGSEEGFIRALILDPLTRISNNNHLVLYFFISSLIVYVYLLSKTILKGLSKLRSQFILLLIILGVFLMHLVLGVKYPTDRTWVHLIIIFSISFYWLYLEFQYAIIKWLFLIQAIVSVAILTVNLNLNSTSYHEEEGVPEKIYEYLINLQNSEHQLFTISAHGLICRSLNHWEYLKNEGLNHATLVGYQNASADFLLLNNWDTLKHKNFECVYRVGPFVLYRRKYRIAVEPMFDRMLQNIIESKEFIGFKEWQLDNDFKEQNFKLEVAFNCEKSNLDNAFLTICAYSGDSILHFEDLPLVNEYSQNSFARFKETFLVNNVALNDRKISVYVWNVDKRKLHFSQIKLSLWKLIDNMSTNQNTFQKDQ